MPIYLVEMENFYSIVDVVIVVAAAAGNEKMFKRDGDTCAYVEEKQHRYFGKYTGANGVSYREKNKRIIYTQEGRLFVHDISTR